MVRDTTKNRLTSLPHLRHEQIRKPVNKVQPFLYLDGRFWGNRDVIFDGEAFLFGGCLGLSRRQFQFSLEFEIATDNPGKANFEIVLRTDF